MQKQALKKRGVGKENPREPLCFLYEAYSVQNAVSCSQNVRSPSLVCAVGISYAGDSDWIVPFAVVHSLTR